MIFILVFIIGSCVGSFAGVVAERMPAGESFIKKASKCTFCGKKLKAANLVPIISFLAQSGKCSFCGATLSPLYIITELGCGLLFVLSYLASGLVLQSLLLGLIFATLVAATIIDIKHYTMPVSLNVFIAITALIFQLIHQEKYTLALLKLADAAAVFVSITIVSSIYKLIRKRDGIGGADILLFANFAILNPISYIPVFFIISGSLGAIFGIIWKKLKNSNIFPFVPAISISFILLTIIGVWPS